MKKIVIIFLLLAVAVFVFPYLLQSLKQRVRSDLRFPLPGSSTTSSREIQENQTYEKTESVFVPYWGVTSSLTGLSSYEELYYFGVSASDSGIDTKETGYQKLNQYSSQVDSDKSFLTLRMLNSTLNSKILADTSKQSVLISQTIALAKSKDMKGVVLDLEQSSFPFESLITQISEFSKAFSEKAHEEGLDYQVTIYGDVFYRIRPFDVKTIAQSADRVIIMAYDFHKARGNPGPNFPLNGADTYGYDLTRVTQDYLKTMDAEKVSVAFGYFGYDWEVDKNGKAIGTGVAISTRNIEQKFLSGCPYTNCKITRDSTSTETKITYTDASGVNHVVWFEDEESVAKKQEYFQKYGISNFTYWAYSYF